MKTPRRFGLVVRSGLPLLGLAAALVVGASPLGETGQPPSHAPIQGEMPSSAVDSPGVTPFVAIEPRLVLRNITATAERNFWEQRG